MLSKLLGEKIVYKILLFSYIALAIGITFNKVVLSLATMLIFLVTLLDFNGEKYKNSIKNNLIIQLLIVFILFHLLSFFWSENHLYFFKDLNSKLPLYAIPLVLVLQPIQKRKDLHLIFGFFLLSLTVISLINFISYFGWRKTAYDDIRSLSLFLSHIRFGLMIIFGIVLCAFWINSNELKFKIIPFLLTLWFLVYTYYAEVFSCYLALLGVVFVMFLYKLILGKNKKRYLIFLSIFMGIIISGFTYFYFQIQNSRKIPEISQLEKYTSEGNLYEHNLKTRYFINGNHVYSYICEDELMRDFSKLSKIELKDSNNLRTTHFYTLVQYMASKGLKKDAEGLKSLTKKDISKIEEGVTNYKDKSEGFYSRIKSLQNEFSDNDPNGKTILQRVEYLKAGIAIFKNNYLIGVGSGDLQDEFDRYYAKTKSLLKPENRLRTHNQIVTYFISFGVIGGVLFLVLFYFSLRYFYQKRSLLAILFTTIILISFISEDTLETQMGGTFFALFFGIFIGSLNQLNQNSLFKGKFK